MALLFGGFRFDPVNGILSRDGEELPLPPRAVGVLARLLQEPGNIVAKQELLDFVWNGAYVTETSLSEAVGLLRQALQDPPQEPQFIQTVHRRGYRFIAAVSEEAEEPLAEPIAPAPPPPPALAPPAPPIRPAARARLRIAVAAAVALALFATLAVMLLRAREPQPLRPATRFTVAPPPSRELIGTVPSLAVSPDGRHIVYAARRGDDIALFHRDISSLGTREIPGTRGALAPFFSPDGRRVGFVIDGQMVAVPLAGGTALPLGPAGGSFFGASWSDDDSIVFATGIPASLFRVRPGGAVERLTDKKSDTGRGHMWPRVLPGGKAVLFTDWSTTLWDSRVEWLSLETKERRTVMTGASDCRFARGMLVCARAGGTIVAAPFDLGSGRVTGPALPLLRDVSISPTAGLARFAVEADTLTYLPGAAELPARTLHRLVDGKRVALPAPPRMYRNFREGPDGRIAVSVLLRDRSDIWLINDRNTITSRLTFSGFNIEPVWSPDGQWVAFASNENGVFNVYRRRADGSGPAERLLKTASEQVPLAWSPDGRELMIRELHPETHGDFWVLDLATRKLRPWLRTPQKEMTATWSPDGKWVAYMGGETGPWEVYVRSYPNGTGRWQISPEGGMAPTWSADGKTIYFLRRALLQPHNELWSVSVDPRDGELNPGRATRVHGERGLMLAAGGPGGMLLMSEDHPLPPPAEVRVMMDWASALPAPNG